MVKDGEIDLFCQGERSIDYRGVVYYISAQYNGVIMVHHTFTSPSL